MTVSSGNYPPSFFFIGQIFITLIPPLLILTFTPRWPPGFSHQCLEWRPCRDVISSYTSSPSWPQCYTSTAVHLLLETCHSLESTEWNTFAPQRVSRALCSVCGVCFGFLLFCLTLNALIPPGFLPTLLFSQSVSVSLICFQKPTSLSKREICKKDPGLAQRTQGLMHA